MTQYKYHYDKPFGLKEPDEIKFMQVYLDYLHDMRFDSISHWSEEDLEFYELRNFKITNDNSRQAMYKMLVDSFKSRLKKGNKYRNILDGGYDEFNHWLTIAETRAHSMRKEYWLSCKRYNSESDDP